jgi:hypothetical protein
VAEQHPAVAFLVAAHTAAVADAVLGTPGPWEPEGDDPTDDQVMTVHDGEHDDLVGGTVAFVRSGIWGRPDEGRTAANMRLIAAHASPDAVLRRVEAERRILSEHAESNRDCVTCVTGGWGWPVTSDCKPRRWPCATVLGLAAGWGWEAAR